MKWKEKEFVSFANSLASIHKNPKNMDQKIADCYVKHKNILDYISKVLLFEIYDNSLTPYYYNICAIVTYNNKITFSYSELKDFIDRLVNFHTKESVYADIYIAFHKAVVAYCEIKNPSSNPAWYAIRYTMLNFRDYLRKQHRMFQIMDSEIELNYEPAGSVEPEFNILMHMLDDRWLGSRRIWHKNNRYKKYIYMFNELLK